MGKFGRCVRLTTLPPSCADCLEIWDPQPPGILWALIGIVFPFTLCSTSVVLISCLNVCFPYAVEGRCEQGETKNDKKAFWVILKYTGLPKSFCNSQTDSAGRQTRSQNAYFLSCTFGKQFRTFRMIVATYSLGLTLRRLMSYIYIWSTHS